MIFRFILLSGILCFTLKLKSQENEIDWKDYDLSTVTSISYLQQSFWPSDSSQKMGHITIKDGRIAKETKHSNSLLTYARTISDKQLKTFDTRIWYDSLNQVTSWLLFEKDKAGNITREEQHYPIYQFDEDQDDFIALLDSQMYQIVEYEYFDGLKFSREEKSFDHGELTLNAVEYYEFDSLNRMTERLYILKNGLYLGNFKSNSADIKDFTWDINADETMTRYYYSGDSTFTTSSHNLSHDLYEIKNERGQITTTAYMDDEGTVVLVYRNLYNDKGQKIHYKRTVVNTEKLYLDLLAIDEMKFTYYDNGLPHKIFGYSEGTLRSFVEYSYVY